MLLLLLLILLLLLFITITIIIIIITVHLFERINDNISALQPSKVGCHCA